MVKRSRLPKGTSKTPTKCTYSISAHYIQFGGELREEQTQKIRKPDQKTTSLGLCRGEIGLKSRDPQKVHLGHLLNVHT